jgi:hypothetical protein
VGCAPDRGRGALFGVETNTGLYPFIKVFYLLRLQGMRARTTRSAAATSVDPTP